MPPHMDDLSSLMTVVAPCFHHHDRLSVCQHGLLVGARDPVEALAPSGHYVALVGSARFGLPDLAPGVKRKH